MRWFLALIVGSLLLAGCSGGGEDKAGKAVQEGDYSTQPGAPAGATK